MSDAPDLPQNPDLIDSLVSNLTPVKPLRSVHLWIGAVVALVLAAVYIFFVYGPRPEIRALTHGIWAGQPMIVFKPLIFLITGISALWAVGDLARPQGRLRLRTLVPLIAVAGVVLGGFVSELASKGMAGTFDGAFGGSTTCFLTIFCGGTVGLIVMWRFWLRRAATSHPRLLGALSGLAAASWMAVAYTVHCNMDAPVYILLIYGVSVAIVTGLAALLGGKILRW